MHQVVLHVEHKIDAVTHVRGLLLFDEMHSAHTCGRAQRGSGV
jgi:hypothetical protein